MNEEEQQSFHPQINSNSLKILQQKAQRESIPQAEEEI
jgi:hypothetical protein